jgi:phenylglyoxylate dehydrogenase beta subunit
VPVFHPLLTNTAPMLAGVKRHYKRIGREVTALAIAGDGGASDVGFQSLSGAAERNEQILFMVVDNEGYMNTGMQRSSCTPYGAWTSTTPVGQGAGGCPRRARRRTPRTCR